MTELNTHSEENKEIAIDELEQELLDEQSLEHELDLADDGISESDVENEDDAEDDDDELYTGEVDNSSGLLDDGQSETRARFMASAADSLRAADIAVLDLRGLTIIADFFVLCTGKSSIQIRAIADRIEERMREEGYRKLRVEGYQEATWILLDYGDVVAHVMAEEQREFYKIETFWAAAPRLELDLNPESLTLG